MTGDPTTRLDARYSSEGATATEWAEAREALEGAGIYWLTTVRPDGRPHVTPLIGVVEGNSFVFCTGPDERKARNLESNRHCVVTTGCNSLDEGLDVVVAGEAVRVTDEARLERLAEAYVAKYGEDWRFDVRDGAFSHSAGSLREDDPGVAVVFEVRPDTAFGFRRGAYSQTRWQFPSA